MHYNTKYLLLSKTISSQADTTGLGHLLCGHCLIGEVITRAWLAVKNIVDNYNIVLAEAAVSTLTDSGGKLDP